MSDAIDDGATRRYLATLDDVERVSAQMLTHARAGNWAQVLEAERRRLVLLRGAVMPDGDVAAAAMRLMRARLQSILDLNSELLRLGGAQCADLSRRIQRLHAGRAAAQAYADNSL